MCTLLVAFQHVPGVPLWVAANRDEALARPAEGPFVWPEGFVSPRDTKAGGSWLGVTRDGYFVGITNRAFATQFAERKSRGELVIDALKDGSAAKTFARLSGALKGTEYNAFHLVYADAQDAFVTWSDGTFVTTARLQPGVHVFSERSFAEREPARVKTLVEALPELVEERKVPTLESARAALSIHAPPSDADEMQRFDGTCVHAPAFGYGTRSSMVLRWPETGAPSMHWAEGSPCVSAYVDRSTLLRR